MENKDALIKVLSEIIRNSIETIKDIGIPTWWRVDDQYGFGLSFESDPQTNLNLHSNIYFVHEEKPGTFLFRLTASFGTKNIDKGNFSYLGSPLGGILELDFPLTDIVDEEVLKQKVLDIISDEATNLLTQLLY